MCGIVGYTGEKNSIPILIEGLEKLEYRGYDSAGVAFFENNELKIDKAKGKIKDLESILNDENIESKIGIGHTRWATHGKPSKENAHPHKSCSNDIALVHNGIIENYRALRDELESKGHKFLSETDTEVIVHLIEENKNGDFFNAFNKALEKLDGSYALALIDKNKPSTIYAARKDSPLIIGIGKDENFVASDIPAVLKHTNKVHILKDGEKAIIKKDNVKLLDKDNKEIGIKIENINWSSESAEKGGYEDFMLKEIYEQPEAIKNTFAGRLGKDISLDELKIDEKDLKKINKVFITACGTSYHAGLLGRFAIENLANIPVELDISSEFRYRKQLLDDRTLVIAISQSGETADTLASIKEVRKTGARIIAVSNVVGSSITREADGIFYTHAGPEIGVAATKTFTSQMLALILLGLYLGKITGNISDKEIEKYSNEIEKIPELIREEIVDIDNQTKETSKKYKGLDNFLFLGRGVGMPVALEGALKLKEISYIHAEGYPAGEMKHGPIALIDENCPVVVIATKSSTYDKIISNTEEAKARGAKVVAVATKGDNEIKKLADDVFYVPKTPELISGLTAIIPLQLFAYHMAKFRGCNVDQPRNLAKSVTVE